MSSIREQDPDEGAPTARVLPCGRAAEQVQALRHVATLPGVFGQRLRRRELAETLGQAAEPISGAQS